MAEVQCRRCGATRAGLPQPPLPGPAGTEVQEAICASCWQEWKGMQVKLINEYRLSPLETKHFDFLMAQMRTFLNLADA